MPSKPSGASLSSQPSRRERSSKMPWWVLRIWIGTIWTIWFPMWARHRFSVSPSRIGFVLSITTIGLTTSLMALLQRLRFSRAVSREPIPTPVFIVGHWRSGTTYLHELLATDPAFLTPTYLECFATDHFLQWGGVLRLLEPLAPDKRPMDNVAVGFDRPQEDEFGLLATGAPSPYETMLFPNDRGPELAHLDIDAEPPQKRARWQAAMTTIMQRVAFARRRARPASATPERYMLMKSPTHTARIGLLRSMFPGAKFVHVVRTPYEVFPSTVRMWREMAESQAFQTPDFRTDESTLTPFVNASMNALYRNFDRDCAALPEGDFAETRYEDLVRDPEGEILRLRRELGLGPPDHEALAAHLASVADYRRNSHSLGAAERESVERGWDWYFRRFGYKA